MAPQPRSTASKAQSNNESPKVSEMTGNSAVLSITEQPNDSDLKVSEYQGKKLSNSTGVAERRVQSRRDNVSAQGGFQTSNSHSSTFGTSSYDNGMYGGGMYGGGMYGGGMYGGGYGSYSGLGMYGGYGGRYGMYGMMGNELNLQSSWLYNMQNFTSSVGMLTELLGMNARVVGAFFSTLYSLIEMAGIGLASLQPYREFPPGHPRYGESPPTSEEERRRLVKVKIIRWLASILIFYGGFKIIKILKNKMFGSWPNLITQVPISGQSQLSDTFNAKDNIDRSFPTTETHNIIRDLW